MAKVVEELARGRDWTKELQILIQNPCGDEVSILHQNDLADKIFGSFTMSISMMSNISCECPSGKVFQVPSISPETIQLGSPSVDSRQSLKKQVVKDRRGVYKKRKSSGSWTKISSSFVDEYAWRKYGQKQILNSAFPRSYFRCTRKHAQGCKATKQVQRVQEDPIMYQITYNSNHTCNQALQTNLHGIILDSYSEESKLINFKPNSPIEISPSPSCPTSIKEENKEREVESDYKLDEFPPLDLSDLSPLMRSDMNDYFFTGVCSYEASIGSHGINMDSFLEDAVFSYHSRLLGCETRFSCSMLRNTAFLN